MKEHYITIRIAGKEYKLKANVENEEELKQASIDVNEKVKAMQMKGIVDKQDILAMVAFGLMVDVLKLEKENKGRSEKLTMLNKEIQQSLSK